jgi:hypothetical protein
MEKINLNKHNTTVDVKKKYFSKFAELISNQFNHGGDKYRLNNKKEFTDHICETVPGDTGVDWVLGTIMKYLGRYKNYGMEKDLLKMATYCYILWLKAGFHLKDEHNEDIKPYTMVMHRENGEKS